MYLQNCYQYCHACVPYVYILSYIFLSYFILFSNLRTVFPSVTPPPPFHTLLHLCCMSTTILLISSQLKEYLASRRLWSLGSTEGTGPTNPKNMYYSLHMDKLILCSSCLTWTLIYFHEEYWFTRTNMLLIVSWYT